MNKCFAQAFVRAHFCTNEDCCHKLNVREAPLSREPRFRRPCQARAVNSCKPGEKPNSRIVDAHTSENSPCDRRVSGSSTLPLWSFSGCQNAWTIHPSPKQTQWSARNRLGFSLAHGRCTSLPAEVQGHICMRAHTIKERKPDAITYPIIFFKKSQCGNLNMFKTMIV